MAEDAFTSIEKVVEFIDIQQFYSFNHDMYFTFELNEYSPQAHDRVALFKVDWKSLDEYIISEKMPISNKKNRYTFMFSKDRLPKLKTTSINFQLCYITSDKQVFGTSPNFQFIDQLPGAPRPGIRELMDLWKFKEGIEDNSKNLFTSINELRSDNKKIKFCLETLLTKTQFMTDAIAKQHKVLLELQKTSSVVKEFKLMNIENFAGDKNSKQSPIQQQLEKFYTQEEKSISPAKSAWCEGKP